MYSDSDLGRWSARRTTAAYPRYTDPRVGVMSPYRFVRQGFTPTPGRRGLMLLNDADDSLGGWFSKITRAISKPLKMVAAPVLKAQASIHRAIVKIAPKPLRSTLARAAATTERVTQVVMVPTSAPAMLKAELQQTREILKSKDLQRVAAGVLAAAAIYFTGGAATPAVLSLLKGAAERTAARKAEAQSEAEVQAAQAEFDAYAKQLAAQVPGSVSERAAQPGMRRAAQAFDPGAPEFDTANAFDPGGPGELVPFDGPAKGLPPWAIPAALGAVALVALPVLKRLKTQRRR